MNNIEHVAIIMDGNGRWAKQRGLPRIEGHREGIKRVHEIIDASIALNLKAITLYIFSLENWQRPKNEVSALMKLLELYLRNEMKKLAKKNIVFKAIGNTEKFSPTIQKLIREFEATTAKNTGLILAGALSYSSREEILRAVKRMMQNNVSTDMVNESVFESFLDTAGIPQPDLIIRTSGEQRLSNFLLWQAAYSEFYFTNTLWPDFREKEFMSAIKDYQQRERRFGTVTTID
ncbi:MAG: isoprenyl transferase [Nitrospirae bacterium]|nr:isoprenyl transferase [Nitrospirota bacterium]